MAYMSDMINLHDDKMKLLWKTHKQLCVNS